MAGYGVDTPRLSTGVNEPLLARCTILWEANTPNVIVSVDVLGFAQALHENIRSRVVALGVASSDFVLAATHTHNGPVLPDKLDPFISYNLTDLNEVNAYASSLASKLVALVGATLRAPRTPCTLDYSVLSAGFSENRASLPNNIETVVPALVARTNAGVPRAVLFSYGAHLVNGGQQNSFDPDYPSNAIKTIEAAFPGATAQFLLGPAGDQNPTGGRGFTQSDDHGDQLGEKVVSGIRIPGANIVGPILSAYDRVSLPLDVTNTPSNIAAVKALYDARAGLIGYEPRHAIVQSRAASNGSFGTSVSLPLQVWKLGGLTIIFSGGEVVSGYAIVLRREYDNLWFVGYANEVPAYIPSNELLDRKGLGGGDYEAGINPNQPGIAGGSMAVYNHFGHFLSGSTGVETTYLAAARRLVG